VLAESSFRYVSRRDDDPLRQRLLAVAREKPRWGYRRCGERKIALAHIEPGKPVQNAHVESFHGKLRDECLNASWFANLFDARRKIAAWREEYNEERPHSSLGYRTPAAFAAECGGGKDVPAEPGLGNPAGTAGFPLSHRPSSNHNLSSGGKIMPEGVV